MKERQKEIISIIFTLVCFLLLVFIGYIYLGHYDPHAKTGVCNITNLYWLEERCSRNSTSFNYDVPIIEGYFVQLNNRTTVMSTEKIQKMENLTGIEYYEALYVNKSYPGTFSNSSSRQLKSTLYDDYSDNPLINCSAAEIVATKRILVNYVPSLLQRLDINSHLDHGMKNYPDTYFNCTFLNGTLPHAFLHYKKVTTNLLNLIPFSVAAIAFIGGLICITKNSKGCIQELADFLLFVTFIILLVPHLVFYLIIRLFIGKMLLGIEEDDPFEFFPEADFHRTYVVPSYFLYQLDIINSSVFSKAGSLFLPLIWLLKKGFKRCCSDSPPPGSPPATPVATPGATPPATPGARPRGRLRRRVRRSVSVSSVSGISISTGDDEVSVSSFRTRSRSLPRVSVSETFPSAPPEPSSRPHAPPISSVEPPSYPAIYNEGTVLPNPVILQYQGEQGESLPPPPSYDEAVDFA